MSKPRRMQEHVSWAFAVAVSILKPFLWSFTRHDWSGGDHLPASGGAVVAVNHVSHIDPLTFAHFVWDHGRLPRYLAKAALFDVFFVGWVLRGSGQIPVKRLSTDASLAFTAAVEGVQKGQLIVVYPEGTITRDPDLWPMVGKTGAARIALCSGAPVIPCAQWGPQDVLWPYAKKPHLLPPRRIKVVAGPPVDLDDLRGGEINPETLRVATERIMRAITVLLEGLRGEAAPATVFDPRLRGVREIGNPHDDGPAGRRAAGA